MSEIRKPIDWTKPLQTKGGERRTLLPGRRWNDEFPRIVASASGVEFIHRENGEVFGPCRNRDLINVPEPAEAVVSYSDTWPGMATEIAALRTLATAAERRMKSLEERLAAIERVATCGTGPNEPQASSPAQADVGEASARAIQQEAIVEAAMERYKKLHGGPQKEDAADAIAAHFTALFKKGA